MSATNPRALARSERDQNALHLRIAGASLREIAGRLNFNSPQAVHAALSRLIRQNERRDVEELRELHRARLERLLAGVWRTATQADATAAVPTVDGTAEIVRMAAESKLNAVGAALRILEQLARLDGLYAAAKAEVSVQTTETKAAQVLVIHPSDEWLRKYDDVRHELGLDGSDPYDAPLPEAGDEP